MKIKIHKKHESIAAELKKIPNRQYKSIRTFRNKRNTVELADINGTTFVIKRYKVPNIFNRIAYTCFRKSKAQRAYEYALKIMRCGISTPFPVAYIETSRGGLFHTGYFISEYIPYPTLDTWREQKHSEEENKKLTEDFINFTIDLHEKGILPLDYNPGNIFYHKDEESGEYRFALTDINRAKFGRLSRYKDTMHSFEQLGLPTQELYRILEKYCKQRNLDIEASLFVVLYYRIKKRIKKMIKQKAKKQYNPKQPKFHE
ncbi:MAG: hypothetical protein IKM47_07970 [Bacteroidaceae bacterium]|nr:hypothetical protein [Bacteroidaceae bacterium]